MCECEGGALPRGRRVCQLSHATLTMEDVPKKTIQEAVVLCQWNRGAAEWATQPESDRERLKDPIIEPPAQFQPLQDVIKNSENEGSRYSHVII